MTGVRMGRLHKQARLSGAVALLLLSIAARAQTQPEDIGQPQGGIFLNAFGVSGDGTVIVGVGNTTSGTSRAVRYVGGVMTDLGTFGGASSSATGVSADGTVIVGGATFASQVLHAFRYELTTGNKIDLRTLGGSYSYANAVSADGSVIVGQSDTGINDQSHAFRYDPINKMIDLGTLKGDGVGTQSEAFGVSADGTVIVGQSDTATANQFHAFLYENGKMIDLGTINDTGSSSARAVSANGTVIVGSSYTLAGGGQNHAFRYDKINGMNDLGTLGGTYSQALGVSANGNVIVGRSKTQDDTAMRAFKVVLGKMTDLGTLLGGNNSEANGVSADGTVIVGSSETANGENHAFIYRNVLDGGGPTVVPVDVPNTYVALGTNAGQLAGLLNTRRAALGLALHDECNSVGVRPVCVSVGGRSSRVTGGVADTAAQLQLGFRLGSQLRVGATVDQDISTRTPGNYAVTHSQPLVALYAAYAPSGTPAGLLLKVSVAQGSDSVGITRSLLANTEAGQGKSKLKSKGVQLEAAYGWELDEGWYGAAFAGVKGTQLSRAAYMETSGADFPVSYQAVQQTSTTAYLGLQEAGDLADDLWLNMRIGVELDIRSHQDSYKGTMEFLGPFTVAAPTTQRTRGFGSISGAYRITPTQQISVGVEYSQQPQKDINGMTTLVLRYAAAL